MVIDQLDLIRKQTEATLRNKTAGSVARLRAETSLVKQASKLTGRMNRELKQAEQTILRSGKPGKHRVETQTVAEIPRPVKPAPDGYIRRSAVQSIRVPADYHRRMVKRILLWIVGVICVLVAAWMLQKSGVLTN